VRKSRINPDPVTTPYNTVRQNGLDRAIKVVHGTAAHGTTREERECGIPSGDLGLRMLPGPAI
jgi:hypothetical protein